MSQKYFVLDIHYDTRILNIVSPNFFHGNIVCPEPETKMDFSIFKYTPNNQNATLFYDCDYKSPTPSSVLSCTKNEETAHPFLVTDTNMANQLASRCGDGLVVPVLATSARGFENHSLDANQVLSRGFEVEWINVDKMDCRPCVGSEDVCRHNSTWQRSICACGQSGDDSYPFWCPNAPASPQAISNPSKSSMFPSSFISFDCYLIHVLSAGRFFLLVLLFLF